MAVDALWQTLACFFRTKMDAVVIGTTLVQRIAETTPAEATK